LPVKSAAQIEAVAARIANVLDEPFTYAERSFALGASIGVALYPDDEVDPDRLRNAADAAMYRAKEDGGARIRFHDGRRAGGPHTTRSTPDAPPGRPDAPPAHTPAFASAPSSDAGYLVTYEPIYYLREAEICAAEAVVRRVDPERGLLPANGSMPLESDPLALRALDEWVVREALAEGRTLASGGFELALDVRLATRDASIFDRLNSNGFTTADWRRIRVAVDARDAAEPGSAAEHFLELCARHGLGFVLDGFEGSLAELHTMASVPVFTLRVNTAFIEGTAAQPGGLALLQGTLSGARALGWRMIANGVETQEQRDFVVTLGVDGVQGPYVGHAMTANDFAGWLKNRRESPPSP